MKFDSGEKTIITSPAILAAGSAMVSAYSYGHDKRLFQYALLTSAWFTAFTLLSFLVALVHRKLRHCKKLHKELSRKVKLKNRKNRVLDKGHGYPPVSKLLPKPLAVTFSFRNPEDIYDYWNYSLQLNKQRTRE